MDPLQEHLDRCVGVSTSQDTPWIVAVEGGTVVGTRHSRGLTFTQAAAITDMLQNAAIIYHESDSKAIPSLAPGSVEAAAHRYPRKLRYLEESEDRGALAIQYGMRKEQMAAYLLVSGIINERTRGNRIRITNATVQQGLLSIPGGSRIHVGRTQRALEALDAEKLDDLQTVKAMNNCYTGILREYEYFRPGLSSPQQPFVVVTGYRHVPHVLDILQGTLAQPEQWNEWRGRTPQPYQDAMARIDEQVLRAIDR